MQKLGVFDSGIGGFTIVDNLRKNISVDIVFLADHKNLPYGSKDEEVMKKILKTNLSWFLDQGINHVLLACNTASTYIDFLRASFPKMRIDSIIEITANKFKDYQDLLILGTDRTVSSKQYNLHLNNQPEYLALSALASLVEQNDKKVIAAYLKSKLVNIPKGKKILLACTHYSLVSNEIKKVISNDLYDSLAAVLDFYQDLKGDKSLEVYSSANIKVLEDQLYNIFNYDLKVLPKDKNFKIVVVSDNHGRYEPIKQVLAHNKDAAVFVHCGDVQLEPDLVSDFYVVNGNNDYFYTYEDKKLLEVGDVKIYLTHGDEHPRFSRINKIYKDASKLGANIICFGHEHVFQKLYKDETLILNPGSLFYNRDGSGISYAIVYVENNKFKVERVNL